MLISWIEGTSCLCWHLCLKKSASTQHNEVGNGCDLIWSRFVDTLELIWHIRVTVQVYVKFHTQPTELYRGTTSSRGPRCSMDYQPTITRKWHQSCLCFIMPLSRWQLWPEALCSGAVCPSIHPFFVKAISHVRIDGNSSNLAWTFTWTWG